jgi:hypothetical protein
LPAWAVSPDETAAAADLGPDETVSWPEPDAPPKGVTVLLKESVAFYKRHARALLITAAILYVPGSLVSSLTLTALTAPLRAQSSQWERAADRMAKAQEALGKDVGERLATGRLDGKELEEAMKGIGANAAEASALAGAALGGIMAALLGLLAWAVMALIIYAFVLPLTQGALTIAVADRALGGAAGWKQHWGLLVRRLGRMLSALIPAALLCAVGYFFFVVPGLLLSFFFVLVPPVVLIEGLGGTAALKRSFALVKSDWLRVAIVLIVFGILNFVAHLLAGLVIPSSAYFVGHLLGDLVTLALLPVPIIGSVLLYFDVRRRLDSDDPTRLRTELEALRAASTP